MHSLPVGASQLHFLHADDAVRTGLLGQRAAIDRLAIDLADQPQAERARVDRAIADLHSSGQDVVID